MKLLRNLIAVFAAAIFCQGADLPGEWKILFNGKDYSGWTNNNFGGSGEIEFRDGKMIINEGVALSGVKYAKTNELLRNNYEIQVKATKLQGNDFFAGITFPVKDSHATFLCGGWGGSLVGISSIDGMDASENETSTYLKFEENKSYDLRVRVTEKKIQAWVDNQKMVDVGIEGRRISMRPGEIESAVPFGISTYQTRTAIQEVKIRSIPAGLKKIVFIAGRKSHGPGEHEYAQGMQLLKNLVDKHPDVKAVDSEYHERGWPVNENTLEDADSIVLYCDGSDHSEDAHPILSGNRLNTLARQMKRGCGFVCIHYTVFVPKEKAGDKFLNWLGGYFDYESGTGQENKWYSKIETRDFKVFPASDHPITKGLEPFQIKEEYYFKMRLPEDRSGWTPVLTFDPEKKDNEKVVGWAIQRPDGGRGFGYTGGHFHKNWEDPNVRQLIVNAILWSAKIK
jgi:type 1 glutamine amidotransferase